jgi:hypothetical protein
MTREQRLLEARSFLGLPHPADWDEISEALDYIEFRDEVFRKTRQRYSKPAKRAAHSLAQAMLRARRVGLPVLSQWTSLILCYHDIATPTRKPKRAEGFKQRLALQQAYWLLSDRGLPCEASQNGDWCKFAAILLGYPKPTAGLLSQARRLRVQFKSEKMKNPRQN